MRVVIIFLLLAVNIVSADAQSLLKGKVYDATTDSVMPYVTVFNSSSKLYVLSTVQGEYAIVAKEGDRLIFTSVGYMPDTIKVLNYMLDAGYDVSLALKNNLLRNVDIGTGNYREDSLRRRDGYADFYNRPKNEIVSRSGPKNGVGIAFSPLSFFSKKAKEKKMSKNLQYQEEQDFVDYAFSRHYVEKMTSLHGDSLLNFMLRYRPAYQFCRSASSEDMLSYINDRLIIYRKEANIPVH
jgi:hypothetical protein